VSAPYIDTDVIVRLLTGDDIARQAAAEHFFQAVEAGAITVVAPVTAIADAVFVLCSKRLYNQPHVLVAASLARLVRLPGFRVDRRRTVLAALDIFGSTNVDFGDCMLIASMRESGVTTLYSYDRDFDGFAGIHRQEPASPPLGAAEAE
jgi:predicted nucleic acid-binding protein